MGIAQWVFVSIMAINLLVSANEHGKPRRGKTNFWEALLVNAVIAGILAWGGFFS